MTTSPRSLLQSSLTPQRLQPSTTGSRQGWSQALNWQSHARVGLGITTAARRTLVTAPSKGFGLSIEININARQNHNRY
eukprot:6470937-Amphidinium_carterae.1